jgi:AcrR family transcriptional regulator
LTDKPEPNYGSRNFLPFARAKLRCRRRRRTICSTGAGLWSGTGGRDGGPRRVARRTRPHPRAAGIATGSFYRYFPSKRALIVEVLRELNRDLRRAMREAIGDADSYPDRERRAFAGFFTFLGRHPNLFRIQRQVEFIAPDAYREYYDELARRYARAAKDAMVRGELDPRFDPDFLAYAVYIGVAHFVGLRWAEWSGGGTVPKDIAEQVYLLLDKALRPVHAPPAAAASSG